MISTIMATVAHRTACTEAEGPGRRYALWFQGCPMRCPGCCNPEMLPFEGGISVTVESLLTDIAEAQHRDQIEGVTLLGGEPFAHATAGAAIADGAKRLGLSVMIFSGYTLAEIRDLPEPDAAVLLSLTDLLVDGRYERDLPDNLRRWIGSTNQRIHFLTDRYRASDAYWAKRNTLEIRLVAGELTINGFPAADAKELWRGLGLRKNQPD